MTKMKRLFAICALTLVGGAAVCLLLSALYPVLRRVYDGLGPPHRRTYLNRDMSVWLRILALTNSTKEPLQIMQITCDKTSEIARAEVPLSYDLLGKYGFLDDRYAMFHIAVNGNKLTSACWPGTNGDCMLPFDRGVLNPGTNQIQVRFTISNRANAEFIEATGPVTELVWTNGIH